MPIDSPDTFGASANAALASFESQGMSAALRASRRAAGSGAFGTRATGVFSTLGGGAGEVGWTEGFSWHLQIGDPTYADAILDRLVNNAYRLKLTGKSMRGNGTQRGASHPPWGEIDKKIK
jgi:hypothetical protein